MRKTENKGKKINHEDTITSAKDLPHSQDLEASFFYYLNDLRKFELLSESDKSELITLVDKAMGSLKEIIFAFAPAVTDFIDTLEDLCRNDKIQCSDIFQTSALKQSPEINDKKYLSEWKERIQKYASLLQQDYNSDNGADIRCKLVTECSKVRINYDYLEIFFNSVTDHLTEWSSDIEINSDNYKKILRSFNTEQKKNLCKTFLIPENLLEVHLDSLFRASRKLLELKHEILQNHLRLVISIAQKFRNRGVPFNDLIQEGNLGLMRAIDKFDPHLGHKFSTYAVWWIKQNIIQGIAAQSRTIRIPAHMLALISRINRAEQKLLQLYGREPESEEIAAELELSTAKVNAVRCMARQAISLQSPTGSENENFSLEDTLKDNSDGRDFTDFDKDVTYKMLYKLLGTLTKREQEIITLRFGLFGNTPTPFTELSTRYNLTRERVRQLELKILNKLRTPDKLKLLDYHHTNIEK